MAIGRPVSLTSSIASKVVSAVSTAGQTVFTVSGGYYINQISVFRNGIRLSQGKDYTASDGSTVTLLSAANDGDNIEFQVFDSFQVADAITSSGTDQVLSSNLDVQGNLTAVTHIGNATGTAATFTTITVNDQISGNITGTAATFTTGTFSGPVSVGGTLTYEDATNVDSVGLVTARTGVRVTAGGLVVTAGVSTFAAALDVNAELDVDGQTDLDTLQVAGVSTFSAALDVNAELDVDGQTDLDTLQVAGVSTFAAAIDLNAELDVDGQTDLDNLIVAGVSTFSASIDLDGELDVDGQTDLDNLIVAGVSTFSADISIADKIVHTGDTNTAIRFPANDTFTVETGGVEAFRVTGNQRIGIGTDDPLRQLEVYDSTNAIINLKSDTQSSVIFSDPADANIGMLIYEHSSDSMYFRVNDAERLRITSAGRVGIGLTDPSYQLAAKDTKADGTGVQMHLWNNSVDNTAGNVWSGIRFTGSTSDYETAEIKGWRVHPQTNANSLSINTGGVERMVLSSSGVGIGTIVNPGSYNAAARNLVIYDPGNAGITIRSGNDHDASIYFNDTDDGNQRGIVRFNHQTNKLAFHTPVGEAMIIDSTGRIGVNVTPSDFGTDAKAVEIHSSGSVNSFLALTNSTTGSGGASNGFNIIMSDNEARLFNREAGDMTFWTSGSRRAIIASNGNVGLGTAQPATLVDLTSAVAGTLARIYDTGTNAGQMWNGAPLLGLSRSSNGNVGLAGPMFQIGQDNGQSAAYNIDSTIFVVTNTSVGVGTLTPSQSLEIRAGEPRICLNGTNADSSKGIEFEHENARMGHLFHNPTTGEMSLSVGENTAGSHYVTIKSGIGTERIRVEGNGSIRYKQTGSTSDANFKMDRDGDFIRFSTQKDGSGGAGYIFRTQNSGALLEVMRITNDGRVSIPNTGGFPSVAGHTFYQTGAAMHATASDTIPLLLNRQQSDGTMVDLRHASATEGTITVSGATVTYGPFLGSHWGRLEDNSKPEILIGTILETINKLVVWKIVEFEVGGEKKRQAYNGSSEVGDITTVTYEGTSYTGTVVNEQDPAPELNKHVCVKVNDTAESKAVFGVFLGWDKSGAEDLIGNWNDMNIGAVGNYFIRIKVGQELAIGDLIESDGNGCGRVQGDDIIRSKTVAKVTSIIPQKVYDDGSFLVTCVLYSG